MKDDDFTYIALYRKLIDSPVFTHEGLLKIWIWCLLRANYTERTVSIQTGRGVTIASVKPGQFIFGRKSAAKELHMKPGTVYDRMQKLSELNMIDIKSNTHYSTVSICNWNYYQCHKEESQQPSNNQPTTNQQPTNTDNKGNKGNKGDKKESLSNKKFDSSDNPPYNEIKEYWNSKERLKVNCPISQMTDARRRKIARRWSEKLFRENWQTIIDKADASDFLMCDWDNFDFTWVINRDENYIRILEGKYDNELDPFEKFRRQNNVK